MVFTSLLAVCQRSAQWEQALDVLDWMASAGVEPNIRMYSAVINACGHAGRLSEALSVLARARASGIRANVVM